MSIHFLAALAGALVAAGGCGMLAARCLRARNTAVICWAVALAGLTVSLGAQALGYHSGFWASAFRVMAVGALAIAPLALALGLAELAAKGVATRFAARLILSAIAFVSIVVLATDPLSSVNFTKVWPAPATYYQPIPNALLKDLLPPVSLLVALIAILTVAIRQGRDPAWRAAFGAAGAAAVAVVVLAVPGLGALAKVSLPVASVFVLLCVLAVAATWLAGVLASRVSPAAMRGAAGAERGGRDGTGNFGPAADDEFGIYRGNDSRRADYRDEAEFREPGYQGDSGFGADSGFQDRAAYPGEAGFDDHAGYRDPDTGYPGGPAFGSDGRYPDEAGYPGEAGFGDHAGYRDPDTGYPGGPALGGDSGYPDETGYPDEAGYTDHAGYADPQAGYPDEQGYRDQAGYPDMDPVASNGDAQMFGQIAIYTLLEDRVEDFDRLTRKVVRQVQEQEPDTLVFIVHAVPAAPMQRILYEVYRDRTAFEDHKRQPYVVAFEAERRSFVLATNVIELGLQQAKVSPLPSVADLLTDTGFDLLKDTGFGQPGYGPRRVGRHGGDMPDGGPPARRRR
jgi:quinol monooxygenase YgiN